MIFSFSEDQRMLRDSLSRYLDSNALARTGSNGRSTQALPDDRLWRGLADHLGVLGAPFAEPLGGSGGGAIESMIVMEELGGALAQVPYVQTVVLCGGLIAASGGSIVEKLVPLLVRGDLVLVLACGDPYSGEGLVKLLPVADEDGPHFRLAGARMPVPGAGADRLLVAARMRSAADDSVSLFLVDPGAPGVALRTGAEGGPGSLALDEAFVSRTALIGAPGTALPLLEQALDAATVAICAEGVGLLRRLLADTISYMQQRRQFGQPLSSFQALRHRVADMYVALEQCAGLTLRATLLLGQDATERTIAVSKAKVAVARACSFVGQNAVQLHGGMGLTSELAAARCFSRATQIESEFGTAAYHLRRLEESGTFR